MEVNPKFAASLAVVAHHDYAASVALIREASLFLNPEERLADIDIQLKAVRSRASGLRLTFNHKTAIGSLDFHGRFHRSIAMLLQSVERMNTRQDHDGASRSIRLIAAILSPRLLDASKVERSRRWEILCRVRTSRLLSEVYREAYAGNGKAVKTLQRNARLLQTFVGADKSEFGRLYAEKRDAYLSALLASKRVIMTREGPFIVHDSAKNVAKRSGKRCMDIFGNAIIPGEISVVLHGSLNGKKATKDIAACSIRLLTMKGWPEASDFFDSKVAAYRAKNDANEARLNARAARKGFSRSPDGKYQQNDLLGWGLHVVFGSSSTGHRHKCQKDHDCIYFGPGFIKKGEPYSQYCVIMHGDKFKRKLVLNLSIEAIDRALIEGGLERPDLQPLYDQMKRLEVEYQERVEKMDRRKARLEVVEAIKRKNPARPGKSPKLPKRLRKARE